MLSAGDLKTALEAGATDYLRKPLDPVELMARIHSALDLSRSIRRAKAQNDELSKVNRRLQEAMENVKTLSGLLPICANCKKIRDDRGYWNEVEAFIRARSGAEFSHGLCPECEKKFFT
jgi:response regulator RpfG family c-di-GMP phosphodiesterase